MTQEFSQLGISGLTLGILFFIVRYFITALKDKDCYIKQLTNDFTVVITNHIKHETAAMNKNTKALDNLIKVITTMNKK